MALTTTRSIPLTLERDEWRQFAECRDTDPDLFFPVGTTGPAIEQIENAKAVCALCAEICQKCGDECARHKMDHCQQCAEACRNCAQLRRDAERRRRRWCADRFRRTRCACRQRCRFLVLVDPEEPKPHGIEDPAAQFVGDANGYRGFGGGALERDGVFQLGRIGKARRRFHYDPVATVQRVHRVALRSAEDDRPGAGEGRAALAAPGRAAFPQNDKRRENSRRLLGRAFRLPTRLAVGFGLEALPAFGWIHPGRWQAVASLVPPFLGAED